MIENILMILVLTVATEAVTEIVVASEFPLFYWFRHKLAIYAIPETPRNNLSHRIVVAIHKLFTCGYCFSVWSAGFFALFAPKLLQTNNFFNWLCALFVLHRLANWLHVVYELIKKGRVISNDIEVKAILTWAKDEDSEEDEEDEEVSELVDSLENQ